MTPEVKVMHARMRLRKERPAVGDTLLYLQPVFGADVPTMGVGLDNKLLVNTEWVESLPEAKVQAVLMHEVMHKVMLHPYRDPPEVMAAKRSGEVTAEIERQRMLFNIACDLKVNFEFYSMGCFQDLPECGVLPNPQGTWLFRVGDKATPICDIGMKSAERIYRELVAACDKAGCAPAAVQLTDCHAGWADASSMPLADVRRHAADWMARAAGMVSNHRGSLPAGLLRELDELLTPVIPWTGKLSRFVEPIVATDLSYRRPRRTSWTIGVILPGRSGEGVRLIVHIDTSGSMTKKELTQITTELYGILDSYPHVNVTLLHSGAGIPEVIELRETDRDDIPQIVKLKGGGGTSHKPVVEWVLENKEESVRALICFTDGESDIHRCFNDLQGVVFRMLVLTRERLMDPLAPYCEDQAYLPIT